MVGSKRRPGALQLSDNRPPLLFGLASYCFVASSVTNNQVVCKPGSLLSIRERGRPSSS